MDLVREAEDLKKIFYRGWYLSDEILRKLLSYQNLSDPTAIQNICGLLEALKE